jgi:hypothetical protein
MVELKLVMIISPEIFAVVPSTCKMGFAESMQRRAVVQMVVSSILDRLSKHFGEENICFGEVGVKGRQIS